MNNTETKRAKYITVGTRNFYNSAERTHGLQFYTLVPINVTEAAQSVRL